MWICESSLLASVLVRHITSGPTPLESLLTPSTKKLETCILKLYTVWVFLRTIPIFCRWGWKEAEIRGFYKWMTGSTLTVLAIIAHLREIQHWYIDASENDNLKLWWGVMLIRICMCGCIYLLNPFFKQEGSYITCEVNWKFRGLSTNLWE